MAGGGTVRGRDGVGGGVRSDRNAMEYGGGDGAKGFIQNVTRGRPVGIL